VDVRRVLPGAPWIEAGPRRVRICSDTATDLILSAEKSPCQERDLVSEGGLELPRRRCYPVSVSVAECRVSSRVVAVLGSLVVFGSGPCHPVR
jgi:hypothetical protein